MRTIAQDIRYAIRLLLRSPVLTLVATLSLGLALGANTAIFSLLNEVFLRPLPMHQPDRLVSVFTVDERNQQGAFGQLLPISRLNYLDLRDRNEVFDALALHNFVAVSLSSGAGEPEQVPAEMVSGNYFSVLGAPLALGRGFLPDEDAVPGAARVAVLAHGLWQRRFGGDPAIVGRSVTLNERAFTVVGVTARGFKGTNAIGGPDLWVPLAMYREVANDFLLETWESRRALTYFATGRLRDGVTIGAAAANLATIASALAEAYPNANDGRGVAVVPLAQATINPGFRDNFVTAGALLMGMVGLVLLIACANVANLLIARATARRQEVAVRLALGASRWRLVRMLLAESLVLGAAGGVAGLLIALWLRPLLMAMRPPFIPENAFALQMDGRVLAFTATVALGTSLLFGLIPALQYSRPDLVTELKERGSQPGTRGRRVTMRQALVVAQVTLSFVALMGAGLFLRSLLNAREIAPGFDADRLAVLSFDLGSQGLPREAAEARQREILARARTLPGVERATLANTTPLAGGGFLRSVFLEGQNTRDVRAGRLVQLALVGDGYFETAGIPLLRGRAFSDRDGPDTPRVVVINETMARRFWPEAEAVGRRFRFAGQDVDTEVVGVARDSKYNFLGEEPQPFIYQPLQQAPAGAVTLMVRAQGDPRTALGVVRSAVQQMEPSMPLTGVFTMEDVFGQALWAPRMGATLLAVFGGLALVLAAIGVYGVMSFVVSQRTRELGIRLALGATSRGVTGMVCRQGFGLVGAGVGLGALLAVGAAGLVTGLLYDVGRFDPATFGAIALVLVVAAGLAIYVPARRASRIDPIVALRL